MESGQPIVYYVATGLGVILGSGSTLIFPQQERNYELGKDRKSDFRKDDLPDRSYRPQIKRRIMGGRR